MQARIPLIVTLGLVVASLLWCGVPTSPRATWSASPEVKVIELDSAYIEKITGDIPYVQIWGDGRVIWSWYEEGRQVREGRLTQQQLGAVVERVVDSGLLRRSMLGQFLSLPDYPTLSLATTIGEDRAWYQIDDRELKPEQRDVITFLRDGAGAQGRPFEPRQGVLYAYPIEGDRNAGEEPIAQWPDQKFGRTLAQANGQKLPGDELAFVWGLVGKHLMAKVKSGGKLYSITLSIPGISI